MPLDVNIDDNNTTLIKYQGSWTYIAGSTRQWEGGVHTTGQAGASATFNFRGYQVWVHGTIPAGSGTNIITITIDGTTSSPISHTSNGSAVYDEVYFASPLLHDTSHTIVVTNRGSTTNGNSEFMLDKFEFQTNDEVPSFAPFPSLTSTSSTSTSISSGATSSYVSRSSSSASSTSSLSSSWSSPSFTIRTSFLPFISSSSVGATGSPSSSSPPSGSSSSSTTPWGGIIAAIVSCFLVVIVLLFVVRWKQKSSKRLKDAALCSSSTSALTPTPFPAVSEMPITDNVHRNLPTWLSEKGTYQHPEQQQAHVEPANTPTTVTPSPASPFPLPSNSAGTLLAEPHGTNLNEKYDFPPPSYQQDS